MFSSCCLVYFLCRCCCLLLSSLTHPLIHISSLLISNHIALLLYQLKTVHCSSMPHHTIYMLLESATMCFSVSIFRFYLHPYTNWNESFYFSSFRFKHSLWAVRFSGSVLIFYFIHNLIFTLVETTSSPLFRKVQNSGKNSAEKSFVISQLFRISIDI